MVAKSFEKHLSNRHRQLLKPSPLFFRKKNKQQQSFLKFGTYKTPFQFHPCLTAKDQ
jgi:hypothetical protein